MNAPSTRSSVAATAMPRTRGALSAKNRSRSLASENLTRLKAPESPFTMTGLGGPIRRTLAFSAIFQPLWYFDVSHQHRHGSLDKSLERRQQFGPERAVDHAVIAGERHRQHARERDAAVFLFDRLPPRRADSSFISFEIADSVFASTRRITGVIKPPSIATATATSEC